MAEEIVGFVLFVDYEVEMIPHKTNDGRLVVFLSHQSAVSAKGMLDVVSPVNATDIDRICKRHGYKSAYYLGEEEIEAQARARIVRKEAKRTKRHKATQSKRKATQSDAGTKQLLLF